MSTYYKTCPLCDAKLDPGEKCDCIIGIDLSEGEDFSSVSEPEYLDRALSWGEKGE